MTSRTHLLPDALDLLILESGLTRCTPWLRSPSYLQIKLWKNLLNLKELLDL